MKMGTKVTKVVLILWALAVAVPEVALAAGALAYVPMGTADAVAVVDIETYQMVTTIHGTVNTHGLALTPDGRYLIAGSLTPRELGKAPSRPEGMSEADHASHHRGGSDQPGSAERSGLLYQVDTATGRIVRKFEVPGPVHHVLVTLDGLYAISTHPMAGAISVVSLESGQVVETLPTGPAPNYTVESRDGRTLFVSNAGNGTVSEIDTEHWYVRRNMRTGGAPEHMVLAADGRRLYVNDVSGGRTVALDLASGGVVTTYEVGAKPHGVGISPDGETLFATSTGDNRVVAVSLADSRQTRMTLAPAPYHLAVNPADGRLLVTSRQTGNLWVLDPGSLTVSNVIALDSVGHQIAIGTP